MVRNGSNLNTLLQKPAEEKSAELRLPSVEAERELVEVGLKMISLHRTLMGAQQPSLGEAGDPMRTREEQQELASPSGRR